MDENKTKEQLIDELVVTRQRVAGLEAQVADLQGQITEVEKELRQAKDAAEAVRRVQLEFVSNMSHELRTPLCGILGYTRVLLETDEGKGLTEAQKDDLNIVHQSGQQLLALINDLIDLSKLEAQKMELWLAKFDLPEIYKDIVDTYTVLAEKRGVSFDCEVSSGLPVSVRGDKRRLCQVLAILIINAIKYTNEGRVVLKVSRHEEKIRFQVEDTGIGIAPENLEKFFQPFESTIGAGLGLPISRKLVELMGGKLHVESKPGEGSIFWFELDLPEVET